ncbi:restriction endonuclease subunit S [Agrobacterium sp. 22094]|uniref:restriction endonuclease subunit S n=1 Tax=Agrobacterium sp. 22094 TaxID=3453872 RepID=UPI003F85F9C7
MSGLPKGWVEAEVREVVQPTENCDPTKEIDLAFRYVDIGSINNKTFSIENPKTTLGRDAPSRAKRRIRSGDVLFSTVRTYLKNIALVPDELDGEITSTGIAVLRPSHAVLSDFLFPLVRSEGFIRPLSLKQDGTLYPAITDSDLLNHRIPIPPLAEQKRIVAKLNALNAKSAHARTQLARIETLVSRYKQAVLSKAFSGQLGRKELNELVVRIKAGKNLRCEERPPRSDEKGVVKVSAVTWGEFRPDQSKTLPSDFEPEEDTRIRSCDFLFSRANTIELVGAVVIVGDTPDNLYLSDKILRLEFREPIDKWLLWYLRSPMGREALMNISSGNQLSMRNIGQKSLLSLFIPYADFELRDEIVRRIESAFAKIDRLAKEAKRALELVDRLDEAIFAKAFRGELVPQDENDEPAEHLLARIHAKREAEPKGKRRRGAKA